MKKLLSEVINDIKPSKEYENEILDKANSIINKINKNIKYAKAVLGIHALLYRFVFCCFEDCKVFY